MSAFDTDFAAVDMMFAEALGVSVTYVYGDTELAVTAEVKAHGYETTGEESARTIGQPRAFRIPAASLVVDGSAITPRVGNVIKQTINGTVQQFEVMSGGDRPVAERLDPDWLDWLIRTQYVGAAA